MKKQIQKITKKTANLRTKLNAGPVIIVDLKKLRTGLKAGPTILVDDN